MTGGLGAGLIIGGLVLWFFVIKPWIENVAQTAGARISETASDSGRSRSSGKFWIIPDQMNGQELCTVIANADDLPDDVQVSMAQRKGRPVVAVGLPPGLDVDSARGTLLRISRRHDSESRIEIP